MRVLIKLFAILIFLQILRLKSLENYVIRYLYVRNNLLVTKSTKLVCYIDIKLNLIG